MNLSRQQNLKLLSICFILQFAILPAQIKQLSIKTIDLPAKAKSIFGSNHSHLGYWDSQYLNLIGKKYTVQDGELFINVIPLQFPKEDILLLVTIAEDISNSKNKVRYTVFTEDGNKLATWEMDKFKDRGLPQVNVILGDKLSFSYPEDQRITILDRKGNIIQNISLFSGSVWNHEKNIKVASSSNDIFYIAGMASANLQNEQNVHLFQGDIHGQLDQLATLPVTVLYDFIISESNTLAISGTVTKDGGFDQVPKLILYSPGKSELFEYTILPRKMIWHGTQLYTANSKEFTILEFGKPDPIQQIPFNNRIVPIDIFKTSEKVCFLFSKTGKYKQGTFEYGNVTLFIFNTRTRNYSELSISKEYHRTIQISPVADNLFFIQLDNQLLEYQIQ